MLSYVPLSLLSVLVLLSNFSTGYGLCSKGELQCDNIKCISVSQRCDGEIDCEDRKDELHCDVNRTTTNATNSTTPVNDTSPHTGLSNITTPTHSTSQNKTTKPPPPTKRTSKKFIRKRVYFKNHTKRRKPKRPFNHHKIPAWSPKQHLTTAPDTVPPEVTSVTHCSAQECEKWRDCWRDVKRSRECACDKASCRHDWKTSAHTGNQKGTRTKDVFEWVAISLSSTGLLLAIVVLLVKRRRLHQNNVRPLHVRTVVCYHNTQEDCACVGHGRPAEIRPLCEKAGCQSLVAREEGSVCYIDFSGQVKCNR